MNTNPYGMRIIFLDEKVIEMDIVSHSLQGEVFSFVDVFRNRYLVPFSTVKIVEFDPRLDKIIMKDSMENLNSASDSDREWQ